MTDPGRQLTPPTAITAEQMADLDRIMLDELGIAPLQLMELAGHAIATFARDRMLDGDVTNRRVVALAGNGGNGGDAVVAARLLAAWGADVTVVTARPVAEHAGLAAHQLDIARRWGIPIEVGDTTTNTLPRGGAAAGAAAGAAVDLIIDGLLGFSLQGDPHGASASLIDAANRSDVPILAIDMPSGLDATSGAVGSPCIQATSTLTLAMAKHGLLEASAATVVGDLWIADIGVPGQAYARLGVEGPDLMFARDPYVLVNAPGGIQ